MEVDDYILSQIDAEPEWLKTINRSTHLRVINPRMLSGHWQGRLLSMLSKIIAPSCIVEIGTFTGYSALCLAEGLTENGVIHTIECNDELESIIRENIALCPIPYNIQLHIGNALHVLPALDLTCDLVFMDADKREYLQYYELVLPKLKSGGVIIVDNTLWDGKVVQSRITDNDKQTNAIKEFNQALALDTRIEKVMVPFRDGITLIRKK